MKEREFSQTVEEQDPEEAAENQPVPGLVLLFSVDHPVFGVIPLSQGILELGRGQIAGVDLDDSQISRRHVRVRYQDDTWTVTDLGSRNGAFVDGKEVDKNTSVKELHILRIGQSLFLLCPDVRRFRGVALTTTDGMVIGPTLALAHREIARAARSAKTVLIHGESGSGKELAARVFHKEGPHPEGPFVALNCAAIPPGLAERLLFGTRKGVYSGAVSDATGHLQAAHQGTLFLDEIAELDKEVQAKLLRALETREVIPLGASKPQVVDVRVCSATHKSLRQEAAEQRFREDLYYRIGRPEVRLPPLRGRLEEIPLLIQEELRVVDPTLRAHSTFVEEALLRPWPGNVRELRGEIRSCAQRALTDSRHLVRRTDLEDQAGRPLAAATNEKEGASNKSQELQPALPDRDSILKALSEEGGSVTRAARKLGVHRNRIRRWLVKNPLPQITTKEEEEEE